MLPFRFVAGVLLIALASCKDLGQTPAMQPFLSPPSIDETSAMLRHEALGLAIRDAVIAGDLDTAHEDAALLGKVMLKSGDARFRERVEQMRAATAQIATAEDLHAAAVATGALVASCAACHADLGARPLEPIPIAGTPPPPGMGRHAWATNALWDGLVGRAEVPWREGAESLADPANAVFPARSATAAARSLEALGRRASAAAQTSERATIYGELLETCADCHVATR